MKPSKEVSGEGPQTSLCTSSRKEVETRGVLFKWNLCILALIQYSQDEQTSSIWDKEIEGKTGFKAEIKILELGCPSLWCHSRIWLGLTVTKAGFWMELKQEVECKLGLDGMGYTPSLLNPA